MLTELENKVKGLSGIINCRITGKEKIDEIHIVATRDREPKRIVRDVETLVLVNTDNEIDHKKISIAQLDEEFKTGSKNRVEIHSIYKEHNRPVIYYNLHINGVEVNEKKEGNVEEAPAVMIARGMVEILENYTNYNGKIGVENVFTTGLNDEIVIVQLLLYKNRELTDLEKLLGAVYIENNLPLATGKACLKALNRQLNI